MYNSRTAKAEWSVNRPFIAKQFQIPLKMKVNPLSPAARAVLFLDLSTCFKAYRCLFVSSKNAFKSYLMIFKCALAMWLRSLTVEISDVSSMYR